MVLLYRNHVSLTKKVKLLIRDEHVEPHPMSEKKVVFLKFKALKRLFYIKKLGRNFEKLQKLPRDNLEIQIVSIFEVGRMTAVFGIVTKNLPTSA